MSADQIASLSADLAHAAAYAAEGAQDLRLAMAIDPNGIGARLLREELLQDIASAQARAAALLAVLSA